MLNVLWDYVHTSINMGKINNKIDTLIGILVFVVVILSLFGIFDENVVVAITSWCILVLGGMYFINLVTKHD